MKRVGKSGSLACMGLALALLLPGGNVATAADEPRLSQLNMQQLSAEQRAVATEILKVSSVGLGGPYNAMLRSPAMADRMVRMLDYVRVRTSLPKRLNEFAILIQGRLWEAQAAHVIWTAHYPLATKAGLSEGVAADLKQGKRPAGMQPDEAVVYDFCTELSTRHDVSESTWKRARAVFSEQQIADLIAVSGTYVTISMFLNATHQDLPPGNLPAPGSAK